MAYEFDGTTQYLSLPIGDVPFTAYPMTMALQFYDATNNSFIGRFAGFARTSSVNGSFALSTISGTNRPQVIANDDAGTGGGAQIAASYTLNVWNAFCGTFEATLRKAFLNLTDTQTNTTTIGTPTVNTFAIGARIATAVGQYFEGYVCEVAVWNVVLTDDEIGSLSKGFKAHRIRPQSLQFYAPLVRDLNDVRLNRTITNNNSATVTEHPRVY